MCPRSIFAVSVGLSLIGLNFVGQTRADEGKTVSSITAGESHPKTLCVHKAPLKVEIKLDGVFEAREMTPISIEPEDWSKFTVLEAAEHGSHVEAGQTLVSLDREDIGVAISGLEASLKLSELTIQLTKTELKMAEEGLPLELAAAERAKKLAEEDLQRFLAITLPLSRKSAEFSLKAAEHSLEYEQEELRQLEKMYNADELTEETEEIILKRARNDLERAIFALEQTRSRTEETLEVTLPRQETAVREAARRQELEWESKRITLPLSPDKLRLSLEKLVSEREQAAIRLAKLKKDREAMVVKASSAGLVYYGHCHRGKWSPDTSDGKLARGSAVQPHVVFMTLVNPRPIFVRTAASEKELARVRTGITGTATATAFAESKLPAKVESVASVPTADGRFDTKVAVEVGDDAAAIMPGMTCHLTLAAYDKPDAIAIPASALAGEDGKHYVYRVGGDGSHAKAEVKIGVRTDDKVEIVQGLLEGDTILVEKP
ncbi:MAG TPA: HlyD family efflux transporter periplasmic adaptor subunit [Pirellulales bacterium]|nr:HlyD family efflux transporter periplasmic adaptor subunit [Pirellulales bacterium]